MSITVTTENTIDEVYEIFSKIPSDIQAHLPKLRELASECKHVTEMGVRGGMSTVALLAGKPQTMISWDIDPNAISFALQLRGLKDFKTNFQPRVGDTTKCLIEECDLLFIDTLHTFEQLRAELKRHGNKSRKYIVAHDTWTFGYAGEDSSQPGLRAALRWFQEQTYPRWQMVYDSHECNGLTVLQRHQPFGPFGLAEAFQPPSGDA